MKRVFYNGMILREPYSGVEVTVHQLAAALIEFGTLPIKILMPEKHRSLPTAPHAEIATSSAVKSRLLRILWEQLVLPAKLSASQASLLHAPAYVAPIAARCPVVLTVHDLHAMTHPHFCTRANRMHYNLMIPGSVRKAAAIITFSTYTKRTVQDHFPRAADKIVVIPPGIAPIFKRENSAAEHQRVRQRYNLPPAFLLFVGDLTYRKNIPGIISAFALIEAEHPDLHLVLAGSADHAKQAELEDKIQKLGVTRRVSFTGYVDAHDLPVLYSMARTFVFPSHDEGFGVPPLEAMACGCPVVCSGGAPVEICADAAVHCDPRDHTSIANAITQLQQPRFRAKKVAAGYKLAAEFSWKSAALKTEAVYRSVGS